MVPNAETRACLPWRDCFSARLAQVLAVALTSEGVTFPLLMIYSRDG
jgi:hypothetical protein